MNFSRIQMLAVALGAAALIAPATASAATITVSSTSDGTGTGSCPNSPCALRQAIDFATSGDTIKLAATAYHLATANGPLDISDKALTITGAGAASTTISPSTSVELMEVESTAVVSVSGIDFEDGVAPASGEYGGEGGAIDNSGVLTVTNSAFTDNYAASGNYSGSYGGYESEGGAIYNVGVLTVTGSAFNGNSAHGGLGNPTGGSGDQGYGGAIYTTSDGRLTVNSSTFDGNIAHAGGLGGGAGAYEPSAGYGGAIYAGGSVTMSSDTFGATAANAADGSVDSGSDGGEGGDGGAIFLGDAQAKLTGNTFAANQALGGETGSSYGDGGEGGAVFIDSGRVSIAGGNFGAGNIARGSSADGAGYGEGGEGGAIYNDSSAVTLTGPMTFTGAAADGGAAGSGEGGEGGEGGAVYSDGSLSMSTVTMTGNTAAAGASTGSHAGAEGEGGALYSEGALTISGSTFSGNTAAAQTTANSYGGYGGAAYIDDGSATISGTSFSSNTASGGTSYGGYGGAVVMDGSDLNITASSFTGNSAPSGGSNDNSYGGALYARDGGTTIDATTFTGNTAAHGYGGALYSESSTRILSSTLNGNSAGYGGAFYSDGVDSLVNSTVTQNTAVNDGGAIYTENVLTLASDTIVRNTAGTAGGGGDLYQDEGQLFLHDSIIAGGTLTTGLSGDENCRIESPLEVVSLGYNLEDRNQCGLTAPSDKTNVAATDLGPLASNGGFTQTVALLAGSPAIDAGDPAGCADDNGVALGADQRGITRPQGARCDIGAYELQQTPPPSSPVLRGLKLSPSKFAPAKKGATISATAHGTTVTYADNDAATTTFTVTGSFKGYRAHGKGACKALPKSGHIPKHGKRCTRVVHEGSFSHNDVAGANRFHFSGRMRGHGLPKGSYKLTAVPRFRSLTGRGVTVSFKVV
jgi:predicted outer membrane repeat protein